jgi:polyribonucleotide nucleotidyltransferase
LQEKLRELAGKPKLPLAPLDIKLENEDAIRATAMPRMQEACFIKEKLERRDAIKAVKADVAKQYEEQLKDENQKKLFDECFEDMNYHILRSGILDRGIRIDGRGTEDIRPITCEVGVLPRTHGSALFTRGETQSLAVTTLGTVMDEQEFDDIEGNKRERFILHYNFPPYSVGEIGRLGTGRREIGHGNLAKHALLPMIPSKEDFPYTVRVVSEIMESNGSSSMASVCGGCLSLLDAGVPMKKMVAGIAMGLITESNEPGARYAILSDILGDEDHLGDMDFKVAGTEDGITAFQMDIKIAGVSVEIMRNALAQAKRGRMHILGIMKKCIDKPKEQISDYAPKIISMKIDIDKIGALIGPKGANVKALSEQYSVRINTEDDGTVTIYGHNAKDTEECKKAITGMVSDPEVGTIYHGTVKRIMDFGAFVEILPGKEGLVHISRLSRQHIEKVEDVLHEGQEIDVKLLEIDRQGRLNLSYIDAIDPNGSNDNGPSGGGFDNGGGDRYSRPRRPDHDAYDNFSGGREDRPAREDRGGRYRGGDRSRSDGGYDRYNRSRSDDASRDRPRRNDDFGGPVRRYSEGPADERRSDTNGDDRQQNGGGERQGRRDDAGRDSGYSDNHPQGGYARRDPAGHDGEFERRGDRSGGRYNRR